MPQRQTDSLGSRGKPGDGLRRQISSGSPDDGIPEYDRDLSGTQGRRAFEAEGAAPGRGSGTDGGGNPAAGTVDSGAFGQNGYKTGKLTH